MKFYSSGGRAASTRAQRATTREFLEAHRGPSPVEIETQAYLARFAEAMLEAVREGRGAPDVHARAFATVALLAEQPRVN